MDVADLEDLTEEERNIILNVMKRDEELRQGQENKASQVKQEVEELRRKSLPSDDDDFNSVCVRCKTVFGFFFNSGDPCPICYFLICNDCRETTLTQGWMCTLCYKENQLRWLSNDWMSEEKEPEPPEPPHPDDDAVTIPDKTELANGPVESSQEQDDRDKEEADGAANDDDRCLEETKTDSEDASDSRPESVAKDSADDGVSYDREDSGIDPGEPHSEQQPSCSSSGVDAEGAEKSSIENDITNSETVANSLSNSPEDQNAETDSLPTLQECDTSNNDKNESAEQDSKEEKESSKSSNEENTRSKLSKFWLRFGGISTAAALFGQSISKSSKSEPENNSKDEPESNSKAEPESNSKDEPESNSKDEPESNSKDEPESSSKGEPEGDPKDEPESSSCPEPVEEMPKKDDKEKEENISPLPRPQTPPQIPVSSHHDDETNEASTSHVKHHIFNHLFSSSSPHHRHPEHHPSTVAETTSTHSVRTASPATKIRLLDLVSSLALQRDEEGSVKSWSAGSEESMALGTSSASFLKLHTHHHSHHKDDVNQDEEDERAAPGDLDESAETEPKVRQLRSQEEEEEPGADSAYSTAASVTTSSPSDSSNNDTDPNSSRNITPESAEDVRPVSEALEDSLEDASSLSEAGAQGEQIQMETEAATGTSNVLTDCTITNEDVIQENDCENKKEDVSRNSDNETQICECQSSAQRASNEDSESYQKSSSSQDETDNKKERSSGPVVPTLEEQIAEVQKMRNPDSELPYTMQRYFLDDNGSDTLSIISERTEPEKEDATDVESSLCTDHDSDSEGTVHDDLDGHWSDDADDVVEAGATTPRRLSISELNDADTDNLVQETTHREPTEEDLLEKTGICILKTNQKENTSQSVADEEKLSRTTQLQDSSVQTEDVLLISKDQEDLVRDLLMQYDGKKPRLYRSYSEDWTQTDILPREDDQKSDLKRNISLPDVLSCESTMKDDDDVTNGSDTEETDNIKTDNLVEVQRTPSPDQDNQPEEVTRSPTPDYSPDIPEVIKVIPQTNDSVERSSSPDYLPEANVDLDDLPLSDTSVSLKAGSDLSQSCEVGSDNGEDPSHRSCEQSSAAMPSTVLGDQHVEVHHDETHHHNRTDSDKSDSMQGHNMASPGEESADELDRRKSIDGDLTEDDNLDELGGSLRMKDKLSTSGSSIGGSRESLASVYSDAGEINYGRIPVTGEITFGLEYDQIASALKVHIKGCHDLAPVDTKRNRSDPYVKVYLLPDKTRSGKRKTKIKKHTLNPVFNETKSYRISSGELETRTLWITVWHSDRFGRNDFLGEVTIPMDMEVLKDTAPKTYTLQSREAETYREAIEQYKGDLIMSLMYVTPEKVKEDKKNSKSKSKKAKTDTESQGEVRAMIKSAKHLTAVRSSGSSDPFVKGYLLPDRARAGKQKTPVMKNSVNPMWNHILVFENVDADELPERSLELTVWDHDKLGTNQFLGGIRLNLGLGTKKGREVDWMDAKGEEIQLWRNMMDQADTWVDAQLPLRASMGKTSAKK